MKEYRARFYKDRRRETEPSARAILALVFEYWPAKSVIDVGCGTGTWLNAARELGAARVVGIEGPWVTREMLDDADIEIRHLNLRGPLVLAERFDAALCLEVAEHLPASRGPSLVQDLARLSDVVLFSAGIPGQGGTSHVNERWQSYWRDLFIGLGFAAYDVVRPAFWADDRVLAHYRQNCLVYSRRPPKAPMAATTLFDVVHPNVFSSWVKPTARRAWKQTSHLPGVTYAAVRRRIRRLISK